MFSEFSKMLSRRRKENFKQNQEVLANILLSIDKFAWEQQWEFIDKILKTLDPRYTKSTIAVLAHTQRFSHLLKEWNPAVLRLVKQYPDSVQEFAKLKPHSLTDEEIDYARKIELKLFPIKKEAATQLARLLEGHKISQ